MSKEMYFVIALLVMAGITYLIRALPLVFVRKRITSQFVRSFLYYVPYVVLSALAFPAIFMATDSILVGAFAALVCGILAYKGKPLILCMLGSVVAVIVADALLLLIV